MKREHNVFEILSALERNNKPMTSEDIKGELDDLGIHLTSRMIRNYLQRLDKNAFTEKRGKDGRQITDKGRDELKTSFIYARTDFILDILERIITETKFDIDRQRGEVVTSSVFLKESQEEKTLKILEELFPNSFFSPLIRVAHEGEILCNRQVPEGMFGLAVIGNSSTVNQILVNKGIMLSNYGNSLILQINDWKPVRCTKFVAGAGVSFDPWELFIKHKYVNALNCVKKGRGEVLADYFEIPYTARARAIPILRKIADLIGGTIMVGKCGSNILGIQTRTGHVGVVSIATESIFEALEAKGIKTNYSTLLSSTNIVELKPVAPIRGEVILL